MFVVNNNIKLFDKFDIVYQWNFKYLDVFKNMLEKVVFIKNILRSFEIFNFSDNKFWIVLINMFFKLYIVDLFNNFLI